MNSLILIHITIKVKLVEQKVLNLKTGVRIDIYNKK